MQDRLFKARVHSKIKDVILTVVTVVTVYTSFVLVGMTQFWRY